jgi:hypothetical protein
VSAHGQPPSIDAAACPSIAIPLGSTVGIDTHSHFDPTDTPIGWFEPTVVDATGQRPDDKRSLTECFSRGGSGNPA